jgi:diaminopimelate decarboxylase
MKPEDWKLEADKDGGLLMAGHRLTDLAGEYGTPLYVLNEIMLAEKADHLLKTAKSNYPGKVSIHYPFKCNSVPGVVKVLKNSGLKAEVMTEFELFLAKELGFDNDEIIVNGPCKTKEFLTSCLDCRLIIVDSISELKELAEIVKSRRQKADILLRINPDYTPKGMNSGSATGSRKGSVFGLDIKTGEIREAIRILKSSMYLDFKGLHLHIGTGIKDPGDYYKAITSLKHLVREIKDNGFTIRIMDTGGGFASPGTRGLNTRELLMYQGLKRFPSGNSKPVVGISKYISTITASIRKLFDNNVLPELILEPGRYLTSSSQVLLLKVHRIKERKGAGKWLITDGGIGTITMPTYYEYHEIFLCNDVKKKCNEKVTISGPCCFAEDIVYKHKLMPGVNEGQILAIMDCGAYFNQMESNFGFVKPPVISVNGQGHKIVRRRESFQDLLLRDTGLPIITEEILL